MELEIHDGKAFRWGLIFGLAFCLGSFIYKAAWFIMAQLVFHQMKAAQVAELIR